MGILPACYQNPESCASARFDIKQYVFIGFYSLMWYGEFVMNILRRLFALLFCLSVVLPVSGDDADSATKPAVVEALSKAKVLGKKKPNLNAKFYMFLRSASWCVPCHIIVPKLMKDYGKMKGAQLELIFIGQEDEATVKKYMKEHKYKCPGIMGGVAIPGLDFEGFGFPSACIVTADGQFVAKSGGVGMYEWKNQIKTYQLEQRKLKAQQKED